MGQFAVCCPKFAPWDRQQKTRHSGRVMLGKSWAFRHAFNAVGHSNNLLRVGALRMFAARPSNTATKNAPHFCGASSITVATA